MSDRPVVHIVAVDCTPQEEQGLNDWYDEVHIPLLLQFEGMEDVKRYRLLTEPSDKPKYVTVYRFSDRQAFEKFYESPITQAAIAERKESWPDLQIRFKVEYELVRTYTKRV